MADYAHIGDHRLEVIDFSVTEESTPLSGDDFSGSTGSFQFSIPRPRPDGDYPPTSAARRILDFGHNVFVDREADLSCRWGSVTGKITSASLGDDRITYTCVTRLNLLNVYNIQAQPFAGTLGDLFRYYAGLAGVITGLVVDPFLEERPVLAPGWKGELWPKLKALCAVQDAEIALVGGDIVFRPIRTHTALAGFETALTAQTPVPVLAQSVEVYYHDYTWIEEQLIYPPGGWKPEVEVLNVNAGETAEYTLELEASVESIQTPVMLTSVDDDYAASSVYTIVANDGLPVNPAAWTAGGGRVDISIDPETDTLKVKLRGATGIGTSEGEEATNFSLALGSDATGNRYSTLRIIGTGVAWNRRKLSLPTGIGPTETGTDVGVTIDNLFVSDIDQAHRIGGRAALGYAFPKLSISVQVIRLVNQEQGAHLGNINGARIWDKSTRRWYRVRTATPTPTGIQVEADDDLTVGDMDEALNGLTVGDIDDLLAGLTVGTTDAIGIPRV